MFIMTLVFRISITNLCKGLDDRTKMMKTCTPKRCNCLILPVASRAAVSLLASWLLSQTKFSLRQNGTRRLRSLRLRDKKGQYLWEKGCGWKQLKPSAPKQMALSLKTESIDAHLV